MLRAALAAGIAPEAFWRLSVKEWRALCAGGSSLSAEGLRELIASYPDLPPAVFPAKAGIQVKAEAPET